MKQSKNKLNNALLLTGIIMGFLIISTTMVNAATHEPEKKQSTSIIKMAELEVSKLLNDDDFLFEHIDMPKPGIKIFNQFKELVFESNLTIDSIHQDNLLHTLINRSDYIMTLDNVAYFTIIE